MKLIILTVLTFLIQINIYGFQFRYINTPDSISFTTKLLLEEGIKPKYLAEWTSALKYYNDIVDPYYKEKYIWEESKKNWLNFTEISEYISNEIYFYDTNNIHVSEKDYSLHCMTSFILLMRDKIRVNTPFFYKYKENESSSVYSVIKWLKNHNIFLSDKEKMAFETLNNYFSITNNIAKDNSMFDIALNELNKRWSKEGFHFPKNPNLKVLQVWAIQIKKYVYFCDHNAIVIERDNKLYLIEKESYYHPFSISIFKDYDELIKYLYRFYFNDPNDGIMVTVNGKIVWKILY